MKTIEVKRIKDVRTMELEIVSGGLFEYRDIQFCIFKRQEDKYIVLRAIELKTGSSYYEVADKVDSKQHTQVSECIECIKWILDENWKDETDPLRGFQREIAILTSNNMYPLNVLS